MIKQKSTKRALLLSALSMLVCISMLIGSTFAWFTDSVTSGINQIVAGNLDIELYHDKVATPEAIDKNKVEGATNIFTDVDGKAILWEPGVVAYTNLNVVNKGSLALEYLLAINFTNENYIVENNAKLSQVLKVAFLENPVSGNREDILKAAKDGVPLKDLVKKGELLKGANKVYGVVIYWEPSENDNTWNVYNGRTTSDGQPLHIDLGIKLVATQVEAESDSFGSDYDKNAALVVSTADELKAAVQNVEDGGIVFIEPGTTTLSSGPISVDNKSVTIIGMGGVTINKGFGNSHIFNVANGAELTIENVTMDGQNQGKNGIFVRNNSQLTLKNVVIKNTGGSDIVVDEASDAVHGQQTTSVVKLYNSHVEDVSLTASPATTVPAATQDTYVLFNYYDGSAVDAIEIEDVNIEPGNIKVNGVAADKVGQTMYLNVKNDAELAAALNTIKTNEDYWNKEVVVNLAAGTYSGDHKIPQYPEWNGVVGAGGSGNNMAALNGGENNTVITFVGETASTLSLRGAQTVPTVTFTGNVTVEGFGNAGTGFTNAAAFTTFKNIAFDAANSVEANGEDSIVMHLKAAANNVTFNGCVFQNATHIGLGTNRGSDSIGKVDFVNCTMEEGGCLSGYVETLNVKDCSFTSNKTGFIDKKKAGAVTVENCEVECAIYFLRTDNSGIDVTVTETTVKQFDVPNSKGTGLVVFRGSGHTATFTDCELTYDTLIGGAGTGELKILTYTEENGVTYCTEAVTGEKVLTKVSEDAPAKLEIPEGVTTLGSKILQGNTTVKEVVIPSSVKNFGGKANNPNDPSKGASGGMFYKSSVETVVLPDGLEEIPDAAFNQAAQLTSVNIPSSVKKIGIHAFAGTGLTTLTIPETVEEIGFGAFRDMKSLTTVTIEGNVHIPSYTFRSCTNLQTVYIKGTNVTFEKGMIFTCYDTGDGRGIKIYVANEEIKERLLAADTAATTYGGYEVICEQEKQSGGYYTDNQGNATAYDSSALKAAIADTTVDKIVLASSESITVEDISYAVKRGVTIADGTLSRDSGNGNPLTVTTTEPVTFEDVKFESVKGGAVLSTRTNGAVVTLNDCLFDNLAAPSTGNTGIQVYAQNTTWTFNNCTFNNMPIETNSSYPEGIKLVFNNCTFNWTGDNCPGFIQIANNLKITVDINDCVMNYTTDSQYTTAKTMISYNWPEASTININGLKVTGTRNNDKIWKICSSNNQVTVNTSGELSYTFNGNAVDFNTYLK